MNGPGNTRSPGPNGASQRGQGTVSEGGEAPASNQRAKVWEFIFDCYEQNRQESDSHKAADDSPR